MLTLAAASTAAATTAAGGTAAAIGSGFLIAGGIALLAVLAIGWFWFCYEHPVLASILILFDLLNN